jgi:hypothetical protein
MDFVSSQKRKPKIIHNGYIYVFQKDLANEIRSYECELRRKGHCKAKIKVDFGDEIVGEINEHTHPPSQVKIELAKVKSLIKDQAETTHETPQNIIANQLATTSAAAAANLPRIDHIKRTIRNQRKEDHPPHPIARAAVPLLPLRYQQTLNGERFLLFDSGPGDESRILIFATDQAVQLLANSDDWFCDGTFSVCPEIFFQLYTIHARSNERTTPCVFALLPNKTRATYERFFAELLNHLGAAENGPTSMLLDFEQAAIRAATHSFPNATISGCFFHLSSNIWKNIQSLGLQQHYNDDPEFALQMRMLPALAFLPPDQVVQVFEMLSDQIRENYDDEANDLLDYFENTYIGRFRRNAPRANPMFSIVMWNMFHRTQQEMPRTNNHIEGWHRKFQGICMSYHPRFWKFIDLLKNEQSLNRVAIIQADAGHPPPAQRRRYINCNERILTIVDDFANRENMQYIRSIAHNLGF